MKLTTSILSFAVITALSLSGCGGGSSSDTTSPTSNLDKTKLSGNLGTSYAFYKAPRYRSLFATPAYAAGFGQIKKAVAIPIADGHTLIENSKEVTIKDDGTFVAKLDKKYTHPEYGEFELTWIIILEKTDGTYNFLSIPNSDNSDSLVNLPISKTTADIDLGEISNSSDEGRSSKNLSDISSKVTYNINELNSLATLDDTMKSIINAYVNNYGKNEDETISETLHIVGSGNYSTIDSQYTKAENFEGYSFHIHAEKDSSLALHFTDLCGTDGYLKLIPPSGATISAGGTNYTSSNPFSSTSENIENMSGGSQQCSGGITYFRKDSDGSVVVNFITGDSSSSLMTTKPIPNGNFELKLNNTLIGKYQLSYSLPTTNDGHLKVPTPAIKLDLDSNNKLKGAYVKWYIYNESTSQYEEADSNSLQAVTDSYSFHIDDFNGISGNTSRVEIYCENNNFSKNYVDITQCENYPSNGLYYNYSAEDKYNIDDFNVNLNIGSSEFRFTYRK